MRSERVRRVCLQRRDLWRCTVLDGARRTYLQGLRRCEPALRERAVCGLPFGQKQPDDLDRD
eukprot:1958329-Prymnesium_polylepis.1